MPQHLLMKKSCVPSETQTGPKKADELLMREKLSGRDVSSRAFSNASECVQFRQAIAVGILCNIIEL
jgi:hypothetical protein